MADIDTTDALTTIIKALSPLNSDERHRTVDAAMMFLGETTKTVRKEPIGKAAGSEGSESGNFADAVQKWMKQHEVSEEQLDQVFHFTGDGDFDLHDAPGKSKKDQTLNTYILTGVGTFLASNNRTFDDATARGFCEKIGCYDPTNHATHLKNKGSEFSGDKNKGYSLTNVGMKRGAALIKEIASGEK